jgi:hypothetical protein
VVLPAAGVFSSSSVTTLASLLIKRSVVTPAPAPQIGVRKSEVFLVYLKWRGEERPAGRGVVGGDYVNLPFSQPLDKITYGALAAATVVILAWALREFAGIELPAEVQSALALIIGYAVSYYVPLNEVEAEAIARKYYKYK